jgi:type I restriction enzyme S subunit
VPKYKFGDLVYNITEKRSPVTGDEELYIGLEHLDSGSLRVTRWGSKVALKGDKLVMRKGDILFGRRNTYLRRVAIAPHDGLFSAHGMILRAKTERINSEYLPFFIASDYFMDEAIRISVGSLSPTVNWKELKELEFTIPTLEAQEKLTKTLIAANDLKEKYEELLAITDDLVKSQFIELFESAEKSFPECTIIEACANKDDIKCGPFGTQLKQSEYTESGVAVWGIPEINKEFQKAPEIFITPDKANQLSPYSLIPGDIAMSRKGNVGQCAIYPESFEPGIIASDVLRIRIDKTKLVPLFMQYQLHHSERVKNQVLQVSNGAVMAGINVTKLKGIVIYIPPIRLQKKFADFVQQTDKSKFVAYQETIFIEKILKYTYNHTFRRKNNVH